MFQPNRIFITTALLLASASGAAADPAVLDRNLNLRAGPGAAFATIVMMPAGSKIDIKKCTGDWCQVKFGRDVGYASRAYLNPGAQSYASASPAPAPVAAAQEPKATLTGPRVWEWHDSDSRDRAWRMIEWHNRWKRP